MLFGFVKNLTAAAILLPLTVQAAQTIQLDKIRVTVQTYGLQRNSETGLFEQMQVEPLSVEQMSEVMTGAEVTIGTKVKSFSLPRQVDHMFGFGHAGPGTQNKNKMTSLDVSFEKEATDLRFTSGKSQKSMAFESEVGWSGGAELNIKANSSKAAELGCDRIQKFSIDPNTQSITMTCLVVRESSVTPVLPKAALNVQSMNKINSFDLTYQSFSQFVASINTLKPSCEMSLDGNLDELKSSLRASAQSCATKGECSAMSFIVAKNIGLNEYMYGTDGIRSNSIPNVTAVMDSRTASSLSYTLRFVNSERVIAAAATYMYDLTTKTDSLTLYGKLCSSKTISLDQ